MLILLILLLGLTPSLFSIWVLQRLDQRHPRFYAHPSGLPGSLPLRPLPPRPPDFHYVEGIGHMIGDLTCQFNARSSYIRCAVNPLGDCKTCLQYEPLADKFADKSEAQEWS